MPGQTNQDMVRAVVDRFAQRATEYAQGMAQRLGQPFSGTELSKDEAVARWNFSPFPDPPTQYQMLTMQGMAPGQALDQVHPYRSQLYSTAPTITDQIAQAQKIKGWADEAAQQPLSQQQVGAIAEQNPGAQP